MIQLAEYFQPNPSRLWYLAKQMGIEYAVAPVPEEENGMKPWDYTNLLLMQKRFEGFGIKLLVIESFPLSNKVKLGLEGRDEEIECVIQLIRNMGKLGIPVLCYNFMPHIVGEKAWIRTSKTIRTRGGALVSGYDHSLMKDEPLTHLGIVTEEQQWINLKYFLEKIVPVAEEAKVKLAVHPDDPPISNIRGVSRILTDANSLQRVIDLVPSDYNGITFCQGTLAAAGENIPQIIRSFSEQNKIFFVHFRDVRGTAERFEETFHDDGKTDMLEAMKTYYTVGFNGPMRPDHVPTMEDEDNTRPGYAILGRLFGNGYIKGLIEAVSRK